MHRSIPGAACWGPMAPSPRCIGAAPPDAQAVDGVCWSVHAGQGRDARPPLESARLPEAVPPPACGWWASVLFRPESGANRRTGTLLRCVLNLQAREDTFSTHLIPCLPSAAGLSPKRPPPESWRAPSCADSTKKTQVGKNKF